MGVKFAGSRSIDERRRRRLAGENELDSPAASNSPLNMGLRNLQTNEPTATNAEKSLLGKIVTPSRVRIWIFCIAVPVIGLLLVLASAADYLGVHESLQTIIGLEQGHLWRFLRGNLFLGSAGLCWLISWFRSASDRDFEGCFKSWNFSGWIFFIFGLFAGCDAHLIFSQMLGSYLQINSPFIRTLIWVVPMIALLTEPARCFTREMWHSRRSLFGLAMVCITSIIYLEMNLPASSQATFFTTKTAHIILVACSILVPSFVFSALLSQVYYVMYVSSDPVPKRESWTVIALQRIKQKIASLVGQTASYCLGGAKTVARSTQQRLSSSVDKKLVDKSSTDKGSENKVSTNKTKKTNDAKKAKITWSEKWAEKRAEKKRLKKNRTAQAAKLKEEAKAKREQEKEEKILARQEAAEQKEQSRVAKIQQQKEEQEHKRLQKAKLKEEQKQEKLEKQKLKQKPVPKEKSAPFKQRAADQHNKKTVESKQDTQNNDPPIQIKPRVRLKAQTIPETGAEHEQQQDPQSVKLKKSIQEREQEERIDPSNLKGLSKKERRKLRKMHREQQRSKAG